MKENRKNWLSALRKLENEGTNVLMPLEMDEAGGPRTGQGGWTFPAPPAFTPRIIWAVVAQAVHFTPGLGCCHICKTEISQMDKRCRKRGSSCSRNLVLAQAF